jgi:hypothetical protein
MASVDPFSRRAPPASRWVPWALQGAAAIGGAAWGFDFGLQVSGPLLGLVAAINGAAFAAVLAGAAVNRTRSLFGRRPREG